jgi:hypothetical protein
MSFFSWFLRKSPNSLASHGGGFTAAQSGTSSPSTRDKSALNSGPTPVQRPAADPVNRTEERKAARNARREQLYIAVREAMTHAGVLSASYKFKVLSLDQRGDQFLVMMDVDQKLIDQPEKIAEIEPIVAQVAETRFEILVTAVYWRLNTKGPIGLPKLPPEPLSSRPSPLATSNSQPAPLSASPSRPAPLAASIRPARTPDVVHDAPVAVAAVAAATATAIAVPAKKPRSRYDPINDDEVAAFKQALAAASAQAPEQAAHGKSKGGPRSFTLITGFEDTEMPESAALPSLSNTQYGDLN